MRMISAPAKGIAIAVAFSAVMSVASVARAQVDTGPLLLILTFLKETLMGFLRDGLETGIAGSQAIIMQQAATSVSNVEALGQHATVVSTTAKEQTAAMLRARNTEMFGSYGTANITGQAVTVGSRSLTACIRTTRAPWLQQSRAEADASVLRQSQTFSRVQSPTRATAVSAQMANDRRRFGETLYDLSWIRKPELTAQETEKAGQGLMYLFAGHVMPAGLRDNPAPSMDELRHDFAKNRNKLALLHTINASLLADRSPTVNGAPGAKSNRGILEEMVRSGVENATEIAGHQAKTDTALLREISLTLKQNAAIELASLKATENLIAIQSLLAAQAIQEDQDELINTRYRAAEKAVR